jgi:hypothetical protein
MFRKRIAVLTVAFLLLSVLIAFFALGAAHSNDGEEARLAYVTKQTSFKTVNTLDIPQRFLNDDEPQSCTALPGNIAATVLKYVEEKYAYKFLQVGFADLAEDNSYHVLILLSETERPASIIEIKHLEFIVSNTTVKTVKEIVPAKVSEAHESHEEKRRNAVNVEDEKALAKIVTSKSVIIYNVQLEGKSLTEIEAWTTIEGKNIFGITLWSLTAKGLFGVYLNNAVLWIIDQSSAWANGWLGWWYENFNHYDQIYLNGLFGLVRGESDFYGPFGQSVHAWAWVRVWYDGAVDGNAGT